MGWLLVAVGVWILAGSGSAAARPEAMAFSSFQVRVPAQKELVRTDALSTKTPGTVRPIHIANNQAWIVSWVGETPGPYWTLLEVQRPDPQEGFWRVGATWNAPAMIREAIPSGTVSCMVDAFAFVTCRMQAPQRLDLRPWLEAGQTTVSFVWRFCDGDGAECVEVWSPVDISAVKTGE